jgi:hypothetical protein
MDEVKPGLGAGAGIASSTLVSNAMSDSPASCVCSTRLEVAINVDMAEWAVTS